MRLPSDCYKKAGKAMTFEVERAAPDGSPSTHTINVTPDDTPPWTRPIYNNLPLEVSGLGFCYPVTTHIVSVKPGSPAAKAELKAGDVINAMTLAPRTLL